MPDHNKRDLWFVLSILGALLAMAIYVSIMEA